MSNARAHQRRVARARQIRSTGAGCLAGPHVGDADSYVAAADALFEEAMKRCIPGRDRPEYGTCRACEGVMVFVNVGGASVEYVGSIHMPPCRFAVPHVGAEAIRWAYNDNGVKWASHA